MAAESFTTEEQAGFVRGSIPILWRFVRSLPLLRRLAVPAIVCSLVGTAGFQVFVWLSGEYSRCAGAGACLVRIPYLGGTVPVELAVLSGIAAFVVSVRIIGWIFFEVGGQWAALPLHRAMVRGVSSVRTTFFDEFPSGKLINRLVRDFDSLRVMGPIRIGDTLNALIELFVIAAVTFLAHPIAAAAVFPALFGFLYVQRNVAPMLQRALTLRSIRLGEVIHRETDVMEGVRTFVLYGRERALFERLRDAVRGFVQMHLMRNEIEAWGRFWGQGVSALYGFCALVFVSYGMHTGGLSPVLGAVVITAVFRLSGTFNWLSWASGLLFESAAHARRVFEYVDLPRETDEERAQPLPLSNGAAPAAAGGSIEFVDYSMSYRPATPEILSALRLSIAAGSKIGIIGRTGAGKTSLVQALFRMVYVRSGDIRVGGRSLFELPIEEARGLFGVVPQDPYLFEGTVRSNLDRYAEQDTERLREALRRVQLDLPLDEPIHEGGRNLSLGERQLLCLARVMLSNRPVIVMDEPTSGVDSVTDAIMQRTLRTHLADRTVLTIAHRVETLARMDRIIELENGRVVRDGTPEQIAARITADELA